MGEITGKIRVSLKVRHPPLARQIWVGSPVEGKLFIKCTARGKMRPCVHVKTPSAVGRRREWAETTAALAESENGKAYLQLNNYSSV